MSKRNWVVVTSALTSSHAGFLALAAMTGVLLVGGCSKKQSDGSSPTMPGITATEIKIGQTMPYSGPASGFSMIGKADMAYFKMINDKGGINGRKINLISLDDSYSPPKTAEQTRKLVEGEGVAFVYGSVGTASNSAVQRYLNDKKVPQLFIVSGADKWADPVHFPWTIGWQPSFRTEARIYARYLLKERLAAKICVLYQNDDLGKDYLIGLREILGDQYDKMVLKTTSYEVTDPTVDSQVLTLQAAGCDTLITAAIPRFAAQTIRKVFDTGGSRSTSCPTSRCRSRRHRARSSSIKPPASSPVLPEEPRRSEAGERPRHERLPRVHEAVPPRYRSDRRQRDLRVRHEHDLGQRAHEVRQ